MFVHNQLNKQLPCIVYIKDIFALFTILKYIVINYTIAKYFVMSKYI